MNPAQSITTLMRSKYENMTKTEKKIIDFIMENQKEFLILTISELAEKIGISEISISRFCKKLDFSGLQSLKIAMASEVYTEKELVTQDINPQDDVKTISQKLFASITDGLKDTLSLLDYKEIERAIKLIASAHQICVYGFGNSFSVCKDIETRFMRLGIPIKAYCDIHMQVTASSLLTPSDLIICVSHTGANKDLLQSVTIAHKNKVPVISITSYMNSPLCNLSDVVLHGMGREVAYKSEAVASRLIHMAISDILYMGVYQRNLNKVYSNINKMRSAIAKRRM